MPALVDPKWQEVATYNATVHNLPWAVWGSRGGRPMVLLDSKSTSAEAEKFANHERECLRPRGEWSIIICNESRDE